MVGETMNKKKISIIVGGILTVVGMSLGISFYRIDKEKKAEIAKRELELQAEKEEEERKKLEEEKKRQEEKIQEEKRLAQEQEKKNNENNKQESTTKPTSEAKQETKSKDNINLANMDRIERAEKIARDYIGSKNVGVYYIDLNTGRSFGINENKVYYSASTGKLPAILYTQKKLNEGSITADTQFEYHDYVNDIPGAMIRGGTGILQNKVTDGQLVNVKTLLQYTCSYSDNLASNMLGYYVCDKNDGDFKSYISKVIGRSIGTFAKEFSAKEVALLMRGIHNQGGQAILSLQKTSWDKVKIPKYLPVKVAHKIGINGAYNHDVAVVYGKNPYIISIMTKGSSDEFISQLSKRIYDQVDK